MNGGGLWLVVKRMLVENLLYLGQILMVKSCYILGRREYIDMTLPRKEIRGMKP